MFKFNDLEEGLTSVIGLNSELECIYIDNLYNKNNSNALVVINSIYEAYKM